MEPTIYFVIPCYNEEAVLPETTRRLAEKLQAMQSAGLIGKDSRVLYVDDGSKDKTWQLISQFHQEYPWVEGVKLAHNRGHQNALLCGLMTAKDRCDAAISMDADLQDDIDALDQFVTKFREGCDVVYGVRNKRDTDTWFKRTTAEGFYKVMHLLGVDVVFNHADYRLMSQRALEALSEYREENLFLRGIVPLIGYRSDTVYYDRHERFAGESKYPLKKMISFALDGITSFSVKPLKLISNLGILISVLSIFGLLYALISYFAGVAVSGWTAIVCSIWLLGGLQMLCLGVVGGLHRQDIQRGKGPPPIPGGGVPGAGETGKGPVKVSPTFEWWWYARPSKEAKGAHGHRASPQRGAKKARSQSLAKSHVSLCLHKIKRTSSPFWAAGPFRFSVTREAAAHSCGRPLSPGWWAAPGWPRSWWRRWSPPRWRSPKSPPAPRERAAPAACRTG